MGPCPRELGGVLILHLLGCIAGGRVLSKVGCLNILTKLAQWLAQRVVQRLEVALQLCHIGVHLTAEVLNP